MEYKFTDNQKAWIKDLELNPRKVQSKMLSDDGLKMCCLGVGAFVTLKDPECSDGNKTLSEKGVRALGLFNKLGETYLDQPLKYKGEPIFINKDSEGNNDGVVTTLAELNDDTELPHKEIAAIIKENASILFDDYSYDKEDFD